MRVVVAAGLLGLAALATGCGGSDAPSVASVGATGPSTGMTTTATGEPSRAALAACFSAHGLQASPGAAGTAPNNALSVAGVVIGGNVDPSSPQFQAAMQACRTFLPGGGPPALSPAQRAEHAQAMAGFAACMRKRGVPNFPDPNGEGMFSLASLAGLDPRAPLFQSAFKVCTPLQGTTGPRIEFAP
jgi:hypothetical protein